MSKVQDFIDGERDYYGKMYVDINYAIDNISPFLDKKTFNNRKYTVKLPVLKKYMELLDSAEGESKKNGLMNIFKSDKQLDSLNSYKRDNKESLSQLEKCSKCACLNCTVECKFDSCLGCRPHSKIVFCDHQKINITFHDNFILDLTNNRTGKADKYKVLATIQDCLLERKYIIIQNIVSAQDRFILYYYPGISEDDFGEIEDAEEFDYIASVYESVNI